MRITLNVDDDVVAISFTILQIRGAETDITTACLDVRGADGKIINIPKKGDVTLQEVREDDKR